MLHFPKHVKQGFTNYQTQPKYSWALSKLEGKGKLVKIYLRSEIFLFNLINKKAKALKFIKAKGLTCQEKS